MHRNHKKGITTSCAIGITVLLLFFLSGCAGVDTAPVKQNLAMAESAIKDAQTDQALTHAPLEMKMAEEKLSAAKTAFENEQYQEADWLAEEALADANLAEAKARSIRTHDTVRELEQTIQIMQNEVQRQQPVPSAQPVQ